jgi:hypothetical protein
MSRRGAEFDRYTKDEAIAKWRANHPERVNEKLVVHHRVSIHAGQKLGIPNAVLKSAQNAQAMPKSEHKEYHRNEPTLEEYAIIAQGLLGFVGRLF